MDSLRPVRAIVISALVLAAVACVAPLIGSTPLHWNGDPTERAILLYARLPRVILAMLAGGALALAGVLFQALLRDALATPYTLGISSGASLGAVLAFCFHFPAVWVASFAGAGLTLLLVLTIAAEGRRMSSFTLLLSGVTINSVAMAMILFLQNLATFGESFAIVRWLMGGLDAVAYSTLGWLAAAIFPAAAFIMMRARDWNLLAVGEEWAEARGVETSRLMLAGYIAGSLITGAVTAITGPIGFVGLIVPHALRLKLGADHRVLIPCSFLLGAAFLAVCDTVARTILSPVEVPVGVITALLGGPFFIWLLRGKRRSLWL